MYPLVPLNGQIPYEMGSILRYEAGTEYSWHGDETVIKLHDSFFIRRLSVVLYLNDDFEGGGTEFIDGTVKKCSPGECVIFPSNPLYIHRGQKVTKGVKYAMATWMLNGVSLYT